MRSCSPAFRLPALRRCPPVTGVGIPTTAFLDDTHTTVMIADDELVDTVAKTVHVTEIGADGDDLDRHRPQSRPERRLERPARRHRRSILGRKSRRCG